MPRPRAIGIAIATLLTSSTLASAGEIRGQAKDLDNGEIANVTVRIFSPQGALLEALPTFANGNYVVPLNNFPANNQGAVVEFSSPNRRTITLTVSTATNHTVNIAMPIDDTCPVYLSPRCHVYSRPLHRFRLSR